MGIYDRDYYREPPPRRGFGAFAMWSVTTWLIAINVAIFLIDAFLYHRMLQSYNPAIYRIPPYARPQFGAPAVGPLHNLGYFSVEFAVTRHQVWRFLTFQFLHANFTHLALNMLGLYFFGPIVEAYFGTRRYLAFYLLCGCSGGLVYILLYYLGPFHSTAGYEAHLVGASAGIYGVVVAAAVLVPNVTVMLLFPPIPMKLKYLALGMVAIAAYIACTNGDNAGGQAAHLGGAALGYLFIRYPQVLKFLGPRRRQTAARQFVDWSQDYNR